MPRKEIIDKAKRDLATGKSASTAAGEFVREEIDHIREGKHGARSAKQAIAIGLSKARRAGVDLPPPTQGSAAESTRRGAARDRQKGREATAASRPAPRRSHAAGAALKKEGSEAASADALAKQARAAARKRTAASRSASAQKAARTRAAAGRPAAARKPARTRSRES